MKVRYQQFSLPGGSPGPVGKIVAVLAAAVVIASALVLGFLFFIVIFGLLIFAWIAFGLRGWLRSGATPDSAPGPGVARKGRAETLEGEFKVLDGQPNRSDERRDGKGGSD